MYTTIYQNAIIQILFCIFYLFDEYIHIFDEGLFKKAGTIFSESLF